MIFQSYLPKHPLLKPFIKSFWYIAQDKEEVIGMDPKMIPDGCYHMVINLGSPHCYIDKEGNQISPTMSHINAKTDYVKIIRSGKVEIIGVVFQPYGLYPLLNTPIHEISGFVCNMEDLLGSHIHEIEEKLAYASTSKEKFIALEECLLRWMIIPVQMKPE